MWQFSLFGIPITVEPMHWLSLAAIGYFSLGQGSLGMTGILIFVLAGFLSVLIHELGHAAAIRKFGLPVQIRMVTLGGVAIHPPANSRLQRFVISAAGPLTQALFGLIVMIIINNANIPQEKQYFSAFFKIFVLISYFWAALNCLPIFPLDGGNMVKEICGPNRKTWTHIIALITIGFIIAFLLINGTLSHHPIGLIMLLFMGYQNFQMLQQAKQDQDRWKFK